jgi:hypothetical protein
MCNVDALLYSNCTPQCTSIQYILCSIEHRNTKLTTSAGIPVIPVMLHTLVHLGHSAKVFKKLGKQGLLVQVTRQSQYDTRQNIL